MQEEKKYVFGWDQPLQTFFLQVHDLTRAEDEQIVEWLGGRPYEMYEVEQLARMANRHGLDISYEKRVDLYAEKDLGN